MLLKQATDYLTFHLIRLEPRCFPYLYLSQWVLLETTKQGVYLDRFKDYRLEELELTLILQDETLLLLNYPQLK